jgi:hypothetical protein
MLSCNGPVSISRSSIECLLNKRNKEFTVSGFDFLGYDTVIWWVIIIVWEEFTTSIVVVKMEAVRSPPEVGNDRQDYTVS